MATAVFVGPNVGHFRYDGRNWGFGRSRNDGRVKMGLEIRCVTSSLRVLLTRPRRRDFLDENTVTEFKVYFINNPLNRRDFG